MKEIKTQVIVIISEPKLEFNVQPPKFQEEEIQEIQQWFEKELLPLFKDASVRN